MKAFLLLSVFMMIFLRCSNEENADDQSDTSFLELNDFHFSYSGTIDSQYDVEMYIHVNGNLVKGYYLYSKYGTQIPLSGKIDKENKKILLNEYGGSISNEVTGKFEGSFDGDYGIKGAWSDVEGKKNFDFELKKVKELFTWYTIDVPFHPYYVSSILSWEGDSEPIDFSNFEIEGVDYSEEEITPISLWEDSSGYSLNFGEEMFLLRDAYFEYDLLAQNGETFIVSTSECGGGSGIFSDIRIIEVKGNTIRLKEVFASGDRCTGGLFTCTYDKGIIYYSSNITPEDLLLIGGGDNAQNYDLELDWCSMCCIGTADYEYDLKSGDSKLVSISVDMDFYGPFEGYSEKEQCFFDSLQNYIDENSTDPIPVDDFEQLIQGILSSCLVPAG